MARAFLSIGANLGPAVESCLAAVARLDRHPACRVLKRSRLYRTSPQGVVEQPDFINLALKLETALDPLALLALCQAIERELGRRPGQRWGPRAIDLDLLLVDAQVLNLPELILPHPRLCERRFVLAPLAEIDPGLLHPVAGLSVGQLLAELGEGGGRVEPLDGEVADAD